MSVFRGSEARDPAEGIGRVLVVGSGPVAGALAAAWEAAGIEVGRRRGRARGAGAKEAPRWDAAMVAVTDRAVAEVGQGLVDDGVVGRGTVLLHAAGALDPVEVFAPVAERVAGVGLCHPLLAVADPEPGQLQGAVFAVAGDGAGRAAGAELSRAAGGRPLILDGAGLVRYHAAAVLAANHTLALVAAGVELLVGEGLARVEAEAALAGLLGSAARNVARRGLPAALTGPIARGDVEVVERHLAALPEAQRALYRASAAPTVELARKKGTAPAEALDRIALLLAADAAKAD